MHINDVKEKQYKFKTYDLLNYMITLSFLLLPLLKVELNNLIALVMITLLINVTEKLVKLFKASKELSPVS